MEEEKQVSHLCVAKVPFLNHLADDEMKKVAQISSHRTYKKGELIYRAWDPLDYLHIVHIGQVKIYQLFESGKEQVLRILGPGEFFGELALFTEKQLGTYAEALKETNICMIHRKDMEMLMQKHPMIAIKILEQFSKRLVAADKLIGNISAKDVEGRLATYLIELYKKQTNNEIVLPINKKDLASYLGTTQETISRRMTNFEHHGWIERKGHKKIAIKDVSNLEKIAKEALL